VIQRFLINYVQRHQNGWNQLLHLVGVPMTFVVSIVLLILGQPWWALGAFVFGYFLQFLGHAIEGNDAGEVVLVKRWLGRPYTEFGPKARPKSGEQSKSDD
jgi:uncharacterized membrane protein YGL010W